eukprot:TRINITY_DN17532_c0_g1_i1.p1 TRINITY_DN17532_c0_g1~~TRINITY_DN17532_c0_g1_i1.p1  ORF type:complete len:130 (-),score=30.42 TRINITY_DN17532_c0_g1_i1:446-835(-)
MIYKRNIAPGAKNKISIDEKAKKKDAVTIMEKDSPVSKTKSKEGKDIKDSNVESADKKSSQEVKKLSSEKYEEEVGRLEKKLVELKDGYKKLKEDSKNLSIEKDNDSTALKERKDQLASFESELKGRLC